MRYLIIFIVIVAYATPAISQIVTSEILQNAGNTHSLYDVQVIDSNSFQAFGKHGCAVNILKSKIGYELKNTATNLLTVYKFLNVNSTTIALCDSAHIVKVDSLLRYNKMIAFCPSHLLYCGAFYQNKYYVGSFKTGIAGSRKIIPFGRIHIISDEETLLSTKKYWASTIWDIYENKNKIEAIKYNPFGTRILQHNGKHWCKKKRFPYMLYKSFVQNDSVYYCGSNSFRRKYGIIVCPDNTYKINSTNVIWDVAVLSNTIVACGSNGKLFYKQKSGREFKELDTNSKAHLYDIAVINNNQAIVVGQNGVVVIVNVE